MDSPVKPENDEGGEGDPLIKKADAEHLAARQKNGADERTRTAPKGATAPRRPFAAPSEALLRAARQKNGADERTRTSTS